MLLVTTDERVSPTRRQGNTTVVSSTSQQYQRQSSGPAGSAASYRVYAHSQPSAASFQETPATFITQVTEETEVIQVPPQQPPQQQFNEISYTIQDKQPRFEPVSFQVSTRNENVKPKSAGAPPQQQSSIQDGNDPNPFRIFGAKLRSRPNQGIVPSYEDQTMTSYSQQTSSATQSQYQQASSLPPTQPNFSKIRQ